VPDKFKTIGPNLLREIRWAIEQVKKLVRGDLRDDERNPGRAPDDYELTLPTNGIAGRNVNTIHSDATASYLTEYDADTTDNQRELQALSHVDHELFNIRPAHLIGSAKRISCLTKSGARYVGDETLIVGCVNYLGAGCGGLLPAGTMEIWTGPDSYGQASGAPTLTVRNGTNETIIQRVCVAARDADDQYVVILVGQPCVCEPSKSSSSSSSSSESSSSESSSSESSSSQSESESSSSGCAPITVYETDTLCIDGRLKVYRRAISLNIVGGCLTREPGTWSLAHDAGCCDCPSSSSSSESASEPSTSSSESASEPSTSSSESESEPSTSSSESESEPSTSSSESESEPSTSSQTCTGQCTWLAVDDGSGSSSSSSPSSSCNDWCMYKCISGTWVLQWSDCCDGKGCYSLPSFSCTPGLEGVLAAIECEGT